MTLYSIPILLYKTGGVILNWFMLLCTEVESDAEFDRCCSLLKDFLRDSRTTQALSQECLSAVIELAESLADKKKYLGNHIRLHTTNCMDSQTTSPVESQNG